VNHEMSSSNPGPPTPDRRILALGFDPLAQTHLETALKEAGFDLVWASSGEDALWLVRRQKPELVLLALASLGSEGWEVCRRLSRDGGPPFVVLDDRPEEANCLRALELGAEDYLPRPFHPRELAARIKAILRRTASPRSSSASDCLHYPGLSLDARNYQVAVEGHPLHLTPREFDLLWHLARSPNRFFSREELLDTVWKDEGDRYLHTVNSTIERLRQKLRPSSPQPWQIETIRGRGYRFSLKA